MKNKIVLTVLVFLSIFVFFYATQSKPASTNPKVLKIYAYDSLTSAWGLLPAVLPEFEKKYNIKTEVISLADTGQIISKLIFEKDDPQADVVVGLDNVNFPRVLDEGLTVAYKPVNGEKLEKSLLFDRQFTLTPFDYGFIGFVYDSEKINFDQPISLMDLTREEYKDQIIIEQAGSSSPGTQLMLWAKAAFADADHSEFFSGLAENVLTVAPDWNSAYYGMFMEGEAPIVLSYLTSPAYHIDQESSYRYKAIPIKEGYIRQVEGAGIIAGSDNIEEAQKFIDFMISPQVQKKIATTQWMFPVIKEKGFLPDSFGQIINPRKHEVLSVPAEEIGKNYQKWLWEWNRYFVSP